MAYFIVFGEPLGKPRAEWGNEVLIGVVQTGFETRQAAEQAAQVHYATVPWRVVEAVDATQALLTGSGAPRRR